VSDSSAAPPPAAEPAIATHELSRKFGDFTAVSSVTLTVPAGEIFGLIGPNGAGKSTLVKMLTTLLPPSAGSARVAGCDAVRDAARVRRHIGYVPQLLSADGSLTGYENMLLSARLYEVPRAERAARIREGLKSVGLEEVADRQVRRYSGGMIRRLEIAQSMLHRPAVLFMDEPTVGLDPAAREAVWQQVLALRRNFGTTILVTTHYMKEADELCNRVGLIARGKIVTVGTPAELKAAAGSGATLDDVFNRLAAEESTEGEGNYRNVRHTRRAAREHG
jgi:ABC-2 type transport system ATP-binding protein